MKQPEDMTPEERAQVATLEARRLELRRELRAVEEAIAMLEYGPATRCRDCEHDDSGSHGYCAWSMWRNGRCAGFTRGQQ